MDDSPMLQTAHFKYKVIKQASLQMSHDLVLSISRIQTVPSSSAVCMQVDVVLRKVRCSSTKKESKRHFFSPVMAKD